MKLGLDIHGVITKDPRIFSNITYRLMKADKTNQVHILTGARCTAGLMADLSKMNITWTHFFSITDYHRSIGTDIEYKDNDRNSPIIDDYLWDKTKAMYCHNEKIDIHIDDSTVYGEYFKPISTKYVYYGDNLSDLFSIIAKF